MLHDHCLLSHYDPSVVAWGKSRKKARCAMDAMVSSLDLILIVADGHQSSK